MVGVIIPKVPGPERNASANSIALATIKANLHPDFFAVLDMAKARPIRHLMVNTNGVRIANDEGFAARLAGYMPAFEVYLQFDSFEREALMDLRGADLRHVREQALGRLNRLGISTTLVVTLRVPAGGVAEGLCCAANGRTERSVTPRSVATPRAAADLRAENECVMDIARAVALTFFDAKLAVRAPGSSRRRSRERRKLFPPSTFFLTIKYSLTIHEFEDALRPPGGGRESRKKSRGE